MNFSPFQSVEYHVEMSYIYKTFADEGHYAGDDNGVQRHLNNGHSAGWRLISFSTTFDSDSNIEIFHIVWETDES